MRVKTMKGLAGIYLFLWVGVVLAENQPMVVTAVVESSVITHAIQVNGVVQSRQDVRLSVNLDGDLLWVYEPGTWVNKGDVLAKLDDSFLNIDLKEQNLLTRRAQINFNYLKGEVARLRQLESANMASETQVAELTSRRDLAENDIEVSRMRIAALQEQLRRTEVIAPFTGVVVQRYVQGGEFLRRGDAVVRLVNPQALEVIASLPLRHMSRLNENSVSKVVVGGIELETRLRTSVRAGDESSQSFSIYIDLLNVGNLPVVDGQFAEVHLSLKSDNGLAMLIPRDALILRTEGSYVFMLEENNQVTRVAVTPGEGVGEFVSVTGDLKSGDRIVVQGMENLQDGQSVTPVTG